MKQYKIDIKFIFVGHVIVNAENKNQAKEYIEKQFGCSNPNFHTSLGEDIIPDWEFSVHPEDEIITKIKIN